MTCLSLHHSEMKRLLTHTCSVRSQNVIVLSDRQWPCSFTLPSWECMSACSVMTYSRDPMDPTWLLCPWDPPGKSTGVRLAQRKYLTSVSQHLPDDVNNLVHTVYESDKGKAQWTLGGRDMAGWRDSPGRGGASCLSFPIQEKARYRHLLERKGSTWLNRKRVYKSIKFWQKSEINLHCGISSLCKHWLGHVSLQMTKTQLKLPHTRSNSPI